MIYIPTPGSSGASTITNPKGFHFVLFTDIIMRKRKAASSLPTIHWAIFLGTAIWS